jgi:hypothetical protein
MRGRRYIAGQRFGVPPRDPLAIVRLQFARMSSNQFTRNVNGTECTAKPSSGKIGELPNHSELLGRFNRWRPGRR